MSQQNLILFVSRHQLLPKQITALQKIHGKSVVIVQEDCRFENEEALVTYHEIKEKLYKFIYYVLPQGMKKTLRALGKAFGVLCRPKKKARQILVAIDHYYGQFIETLNQVFGGKGNKKYRNRSFWSNGKKYH